MTNHSLRTDQATVDLILTIAARPNARISGKAIRDHFPRAGAALIAAGILVREGDVRVATSSAEDGDHVVGMTRSPVENSDGFFDGDAGWIRPTEGETAVFKLEFNVLFGRLLARLDCTHANHHIEVVRGAVWNVGLSRAATMPAGTEVWIARRLGEPKILSAFCAVTDAGPSTNRLVICLTATSKLPGNATARQVLIGVDSVLGPDQKLVIAPDLLALHAGSRGGDDEVITVMADGGVVTVRGKKYPFSGSKQRAVIRHLYKAWLRDEPDCLTVEVLEAAECRPSVNTLAKLFAGRSDWRDFISERDGRCRIDI